MPEEKSNKSAIKQLSRQAKAGDYASSSLQTCNIKLKDKLQR
jgi:hypothetical protein